MLEILETNFTDTAQLNTYALRVPKAIHLLPGENGEIWGRIEVGGKSGVLDHKSFNISKTREDRGKVTMGGGGL